MQRRQHHASAPVDFHKWVTGTSGADRVLPKPKMEVGAPAVWSPLPQATFNSYNIQGTTMQNSMRAQDDWHLKDVGQGAFTFNLKNAGGNLVISLSSWTHSDLFGYYIVLDDDNHESYVMRLSRVGNNGLLQNRMDGTHADRSRGFVRMPGVYVDKKFRLNFHERTTLWVLYSAGALVVGVGKTPGQGRQVLYMEPDNRNRGDALDLYHFGFGKMGTRWGPPITVDEVQSWAYEKGARIPVPSRTVSSGVTGATVSESSNANGPLYMPRRQQDAL